MAVTGISRVYANLIIAGRKKFSEVPAKSKEDVKDALELAVSEKRLTEDKLVEILAQ